MLILVLELLGSIGMILLSYELFADSVEQVGNRFGMSRASGSLLAAVGAGMPETMIPTLLPFSAKDRRERRLE
jgi:Ca2+/Na+ antiporter